MNIKQAVQARLNQQGLAIVLTPDFGRGVIAAALDCVLLYQDLKTLAHAPLLPKAERTAAYEAVFDLHPLYCDARSILRDELQTPQGEILLACLNI
jgi:hypothetical protein